MKNSFRYGLYLWSCMLLTLTVWMSLTSCEQEIYSREPMYDTMFLSADSIDFDAICRTMTFSPGQKVYVGILIADDGAYITRADQTWTLRGPGMEEQKVNKSVIDPCGKEPTWSFIAPLMEGEYTVSFKEKYSFSAQKPDGTIFGQSDMLNTRFRVKE